MATTKAKVAKHPKGSAMAGRQRKPVDTSKYTGHLALHLQALCEAKGVSIEQLAEKAGLPLSTVYAYIGGTRGIPADVYPDLARALKVSAAEFLPKFPPPKKTGK